MAFLLSACGPPKEVEAPTLSAEIACPAPIGEILREDCAAIGAVFEPLAVGGALERAGKGQAGLQRTEAIRAAVQLAEQVKGQRVELCESYNRCQMTRGEHEARDKQLTDLMAALLDLWGNRKFSAPEEVARFHAGVQELSVRLSGRGDAPAEPKGVPAAKPAIPALPGGKLQQIAAEGISFSPSGEGVTVQAKEGPPRLVLRSSTTLPLRGGRRYLVRVHGSYAPAAPGLIAPGDEVTGRFRFRAAQDAELYLGLRSLEDPESQEGLTPLQITAKEKGVREAKLVAEPGASGFYLVVGSRGTGQVHLDDVELVRGGNVLAAARAEAATEPQVKTSCAPDKAQPLGGKASLRCEGSGDLVSVGTPDAYLEIAIRGASGDRAVLRTQSLEGGRRLDATLKEDAELLITVAGAGTATVRAVEVQAVGP
ncbi:hypothetical protein [Chondromyces crocatus]|uniref:Uncharacterized protein n=1 Tax=Chondromyces crocatus TaxID=52 RepID=A0A0K1EJF9_CHOCO|nr:hypothetical protein [Chondromyces crocatus]AKT41006.1 uncharacterized protein CMC5_051640 [Chondromyces crocatus]